MDIIRLLIEEKWSAPPSSPLTHSLNSLWFIDIMLLSVERLSVKNTPPEISASFLTNKHLETVSDLGFFPNNTPPKLRLVQLKKNELIRNTDVNPSRRKTPPFPPEIFKKEQDSTFKNKLNGFIIYLLI